LSAELTRLRCFYSWQPSSWDVIKNCPKYSRPRKQGKCEHCWQRHDIRLTASFQDNPRVSRHQNVSILDFRGAKDDGDGGDNWSWLDAQSNRLHHQTNTQILQTGCPSCHSTEGEKYHFPRTCSPKAHLGSSNIVFDH